MTLSRAFIQHSIGTPRAFGSRRASLRDGRAAFSLIELVVVLLIVAIVTAIAVPRFGNGAARARLEFAANQLGGDILLTRDQARAASAPRYLAFKLGTGAYSFLDEAEAPLVRRNLGGEPALATIARTNLAGDRVAMTAYGLPAQAGRILLSSGGNVIVLTVESDATVTISGVAAARTSSPTLADAVADLGSKVRVRELTAAPAALADAVAPSEGK